MTKPNENGVYEPQTTGELARRGRSYVNVEIAQCEDRLYRYALDMAYSYGGFCGPITNHSRGYASPEAAKIAATEELLQRFPKARPTEPQSVHDELRELKARIERASREPMLF